MPQKITAEREFNSWLDVLYVTNNNEPWPWKFSNTKSRIFCSSYWKTLTGIRLNIFLNIKRFGKLFVARRFTVLEHQCSFKKPSQDFKQAFKATLLDFTKALKTLNGSSQALKMVLTFSTFFFRKDAFPASFSLFSFFFYLNL